MKVGKPESADVSVVMPAYNRAHTIGRALESINAQTVQPLEVIVVDDASSDDTVGVAKSHGARVIELTANGGSGPARNRGIEAARARWIAFLDSDDEWMPHHVECLLRGAADYDLVSATGFTSRSLVIGNPGDRPIEVDSRKVLISNELVVTSATMVKRDALLMVGGFRDLRRAQDLDMWVRVLGGRRGVTLPEVTLLYHEHGEQASRDRSLMVACVAQIIDDASKSGWFRGSRDRDRAATRLKWDELRAGQRNSSWPEAATALLWIVRRPHTWLTLVNVLRHRRSARNKSSRVARSLPGRPVQ